MRLDYLAASIAASLLLGGTALAQGMPGPMKSMKGSVRITFTAQNNSGETGFGYLMPDGDKTKVMIALKGAPAGAQPAHIHEGTCAKLNSKPAYALSDLNGGKSNTELNVPFAKLTAGNYAVNVHGSDSEMTSVSCADITAGT